MLDCSDSNLPSCFGALSMCCRGRGQAVGLCPEASGGQTGHLFDITCAASSLELISQFVCLFVCLGKHLCSLGNCFSSNLDFAANLQPEGLFTLAVCPACVGFSCSLVCFDLEEEGAQDAHAGSVPGVQFIELTSRNGNDRDIGWIDTRPCHRPCR